MIGTQKLADMIAAVVLTVDEFGELTNSETLPAGWSHLGTGSERHAFLGPDGVVYKRTVNSGSKYANSNEHENFCQNASTVPQGVRMAACALFFCGDVDVLAMEYVEGVGEYDEYSAEIWPVVSSLTKEGWFDLHTFNFAMDGDTLVMIDYSR